MDPTYHNTLPNRRRLRQEGADYTDCGSYFITLCVQDRRPLLWNMTQSFVFGSLQGTLPESGSFQPALSLLGKTVQECILRIPEVYRMVTVEAFSIMPEHIHLILCIRPDGNGMKASSINIPHIIQQFKRSVTVKAGVGIWQKSYYDRILRNEREYAKACEYILRNPENWRNEYLQRHDIQVQEDGPDV